MTMNTTLAARLREAEKHYRLGFQLGDLLSEAAAALESVTPQEDADELEAWKIYESNDGSLEMQQRHASSMYLGILAALKRGRELERSDNVVGAVDEDDMEAWRLYVEEAKGNGAFDFAERKDSVIYNNHLRAVKLRRSLEQGK